MIHKLKAEQKWLSRILTGEKTFDVRKNDRDYQVGDTIQLLPLQTKVDGLDVYSIRSPIPNYSITYIYYGPGMDTGYVVLGLKEIKN